ncbi:hypothetical protein ACQCT5_04545 [Sutcliffiella halmapala]
MTVYDLIMQNDNYRKQVLIQFGFGEVQPKKVETWFKKLNPVVFNQFKKDLKNGNVVGFNPKTTEATTREERDALLDKAMNHMEQQERKVVSVYEDDLNALIELKRNLEYENDGYFNLINTFLDSRDIRKDFLNFMEEMKKEEESQTESMYMGDLEWHLKDFAE